ARERPSSERCVGGGTCGAAGIPAGRAEAESPCAWPARPEVANRCRSWPRSAATVPERTGKTGVRVGRDPGFSRPGKTRTAGRDAVDSCRLDTWTCLAPAPAPGARAEWCREPRPWRSLAHFRRDLVPVGLIA